MASPNDTVALPGVTITDPSGNDWYIQNGQVYENGTVDAGTNNVDAIALVDGNIWQQANPSGTPLWWAKTGGPGSFDGWTSGPGTNNSNGTPTSPLQPSPDGTTIAAGGSPLVDSQGNLWWISGGQVVENGQPDAGTDNVTQMAYEGGLIWQEATPSWSASPLWWAKTGGPGAYDGWTSGPGTDNANGSPTSPILASSPPPADLTWTGLAGDTLASNPANWSPTSVPQPGDSLFMNPGATITVTGAALAGDTLFENGNNLSTPAADTLSLNGGDVTFNLDEGSPAGYPNTVINIADNTNWIGGFNAGPYGGGVSVQATGAGQFSNTNSTIDNSVVINAPVTGNGTFTVNEAHNTNAKLEFMHDVSSGQSVSIGGYAAYGGEFGTAQVDDPSTYQASTSLAFGELILKGVTADSYTFNNDLLSLSSGGKVVDTVNLALDTKAVYGPQNFGVSQVGSDIYVHANGASYTAGGTLLS